MRGAEAAAPCTQSGHWNPTEALIMQSGQIGRAQRVPGMCPQKGGIRPAVEGLAEMPPSAGLPIPPGLKLF